MCDICNSLELKKRLEKLDFMNMSVFKAKEFMVMARQNVNEDGIVSNDFSNEEYKLNSGDNYAEYEKRIVMHLGTIALNIFWSSVKVEEKGRAR